MPKDFSSPQAGKARKRWGHRLMATGAAMLMALVSTSADALAYRCELPPAQPGGPREVRYQTQPCEGGRAVHHADQRTAAQRTDTAKATVASAKLGKQLERERRRAEKQAAGQPPIAMDDAKPPAPPAAPSTQGQTLKRTRPFTAKVPKAKAAAEGGKRTNPSD